MNTKKKNFKKIVFQEQEWPSPPAPLQLSIASLCVSEYLIAEPLQVRITEKLQCMRL